MIGDKLKEIREKSGMNKKEFAKYLDVKYTTYNGYETGAREPSSDFLVLISKKMKVSVDYIMGLTSEMEILNAYSLKSSEYEGVKKYRDLDTYGQDLVSTVLNKEYDRCINQQEYDCVNESELPLFLLPSSTGTGVFLDSDDYELCTFKDAPLDANFAVKVSGDSMEPAYQSGDVVYVKQQQNLRDGQVGIFIFNGEGYIKELDQNGHSLISLNENYAPIVVKASDDLRIVGKVLGKA